MIHYKEQYFLSEGEKEELKSAIQLIPKEKRHEAIIASIVTKNKKETIYLFGDEGKKICEIHGPTAEILTTVLGVRNAEDLITFCKTHTPDLYQELFQS